MRALFCLLIQITKSLRDLPASRLVVSHRSQHGSGQAQRFMNLRKIVAALQQSHPTQVAS